MRSPIRVLLLPFVLFSAHCASVSRPLPNNPLAAAYESRPADPRIPHLAHLLVKQVGELTVKDIPVFVEPSSREFMLLHPELLATNKQILWVELKDNATTQRYTTVRWNRTLDGKLAIQLFQPTVSRSSSRSYSGPFIISALSLEEEADKVIGKYSYGLWLRQEKLVQALLKEVWKGNYWLLHHSIQAVHFNNRDDIAVEFLEACPDALLRIMTANREGRLVLDSLFNELSQGSEWDDEALQSARILRLRIEWAKELHVPHQMTNGVKTMNPVKVFPVRRPSLTTIRVSNLYASRVGDGQIRVRLGSTVCYFDKFKSQRDTLPKEVCTDQGIVLEENEVIKIYNYDDNEEFYTVPLALIRFSNKKWARYAMMGVEAAALVASGAALARAGVQGVLWFVDLAVTGAWFGTIVIESYRGEILRVLGPQRGQKFLTYIGYLQMATTLYGVVRAGVQFYQLVQASRAATTLAEEARANKEVAQAIEQALKTLEQAEQAQMAVLRQALGMTESQLAKVTLAGKEASRYVYELMTQKGHLWEFLQKLEGLKLPGAEKLMSAITRDFKALQAALAVGDTTQTTQIFLRVMGSIREAQVAQALEAQGFSIKQLGRIVRGAGRVDSDIDVLAQTGLQWTIGQVKANRSAVLSSGSSNWGGFTRQALVTKEFASNFPLQPGQNIRLVYFVDEISTQAFEFLKNLGFDVIVNSTFLGH